MRIKRNDIVIAIRGSQRSSGKTGKILRMVGGSQRAVVEGMNLVKRHMKRQSRENPKGGIVEREASIAIANLMLYCPECKKGVRMVRRTEGDRRIRKCRICGHIFDT